MDRDKKLPIICAHRGASGTHPENTAAAFDEALGVGAQMIEFDVRRTRDGNFVIVHDPTVDRTTDGNGAISELTFDYIRSLDAGQGEQVLTLPKAMAYARKARLNIHAYPESDEDALAIANALVPYFTDGDIYDWAFVTAADLNLLKHVRKADPQIRLCNLIGQGAGDYVAAALLSHPCEVLQPRNTIVTRQLVEEAHAQGLKVNSFFADDEDEMKRLIACGVDGILTNYPARLLACLEKK
ncbi:hypothetical protein JYU15_00995 [bacterium AH-315-I18]|nr:hypothetical protein [Phycisphaeraceae bacterium]MBN4060989.1 hypothetical protein [bacterium AH-315-I18]